MKPHTTVTLDRKWFKKHRACADGLRNVAHLLPVTLSTDPEENIDLAYELADTKDGSGCTCYSCTCEADVTWLEDTVTQSAEIVWQHPLDSGRFDLSLLCQMLAAVADKLATQQGR